MGKKRTNLAMGGLLLAGLGYLAGILTAPKSGKETRRDLQRAARQAKVEAEKKLKAVHAELSDLVDKGKRSVKSLKNKTKDDASKAVKVGQTAKNRVREVLSAFHEGETDDEELKKALEEANEAVRLLRKYVKKHAEVKKAK